MFCRNCGAQIVDQAVMCPKCGTPVAGKSNHVAGATLIPNHLVGSILATIFCCLPFGIPAIVYAAQANTLVAAGDIDGALKASKNASTWIAVSVGIGVVVALVYVIVGVIGAALD
ncbi:MAG: CD225/dispanin family protein [Kiritimatiellae bacterium]|nr:CD225/dispanin family protein [Kiritimatiellia bacterium]